MRIAGSRLVIPVGSAAILVIAAWCAILPAASISAEETTQLTVEDVRSDYERLEGNWSPIPYLALLAVVAAEDPDFFSKPAQNTTITVQLGQRYIKTAMRTILLRATQYYNATILARELTHDEILNWYSQEVWLGYGCYGLPGAAKAYFGKDVGALEIQELALLAALIRSPDKFDPVRRADLATARRNHVIDEMMRAGHLTQAEAFEAAVGDLNVQVPVQRCEND